MINVASMIKIYTDISYYEDDGSVYFYVVISDPENNYNIKIPTHSSIESNILANKLNDVMNNYSSIESEILEEF